MRQDGGKMSRFSTFGAIRALAGSMRKIRPAWLASMLAIFTIPAAALAWQNSSPGSSLEPKASQPLATTHTTSSITLNKKEAADDTALAPSVSSAPGTSSHLDTSVSTTPSGTNVTVNGKPVALPPSGALHTQTQDANGLTTLDISVQTDGSGSASSSSSTSIQVHTDSQTMDSSDTE